MNFINTKTFLKEDAEAMKLRKMSFRENLRLLFSVLFLANLTISAFNCFPYFENKRKFVVPIYLPIDFHVHYYVYYGVYLCMIFCSWTAGCTMSFGCMFMSSLFGFLSSEFRVLGLSYDKAFKEMESIENHTEEFLETILEKLRANTIRHCSLLE